MLNSQKGIGFVVLLVFIVTFVGLFIGGDYIYHHSAKANYSKVYKSCAAIDLTSQIGAQYFMSDNDYGNLRNCFLGNYNLATSTTISMYMHGVDIQSSQTFTYNERTITNISILKGSASRESTLTQVCSSAVEKSIGIIFRCENNDFLFSKKEMSSVSNNYF